ncbi:DUF1491 family protein [Qipengyuania psychrotolerans]|uniref:DUF1491 family protein n=1 Tax=Qipengyuania psychrotolerans TaxID=2867238 RepID=A0ABX8ZE75_9SPHN|nr:DUF1491 family protein [Qipengyuania psychrotolerans]QZD87031.1 DUF1491 family protein [Qipengyuania psychrotolerans]
MEDARLPTHLEVSGLIRIVQAAGGFATVLHKGERDAGTLAVLTTQSGKNTMLWERMPQLDGSRRFVCTRMQDPEKKHEFDDYVRRRGEQDPDLWILELDGPEMERFVEMVPR